MIRLRKFPTPPGGAFARLGLDYNLLKLSDRSQHHTITAGFRYGTSVFKHNAENITVVSDYWGNFSSGKL